MPKHTQRLLSVFEKTLFILSLILIVVIPLLPKVRLFDVPQTYVAIRTEDFLIALVLVLWIVFILAAKKTKTILSDSINKGLLLFFAVGAVSSFSAVFITQTVYPHLTVLHLLRRMEMMVLLPVFATVINTKFRLKITLALLALVVLVVNLYALGQQYLHFPIFSTMTSELSKGQVTYVDAWTRIHSTFAGHYDLSVFIVMVVSMAVSLIFYYRNIFVKMFIMFLLGLSAIVLTMTASRLSFVAAVLALVISVVITGNKKYLVVLMLLALVIAIYPSSLRDRLVSTVRVNILQSGQRYTGDFEEQQLRSQLNIPTLPGEKSIASLSAESTSTATVSSSVAADVVPGEPVNTTDLGVYRSFAIRLDQEWPRALRAYQKNPLLGTGYSSIDLATDNDYLRALGETGLLGAAVFTLLIISIIKKVKVSLKSKDILVRLFAAGVLTLITTFLINALFIDVFEASKVAGMFWILCGIGVSLGKQHENI